MPAASELRHDPLTGRLTIVASGRAGRPRTVARDESDGDADRGVCPFCDGHEAMTPPEVYRVGPGARDTPGWRVRVVPNLYPIVADEAGTHEVVVLSPDHDRAFGALGDDAVLEVAHVVRDRAALHIRSGSAYAV